MVERAERLRKVFTPVSRFQVLKCQWLVGGLGCKLAYLLQETFDVLLFFTIILLDNFIMNTNLWTAKKSSPTLASYEGAFLFTIEYGRSEFCCLKLIAKIAKMCHKISVQLIFCCLRKLPLRFLIPGSKSISITSFSDRFKEGSDQWRDRSTISILDVRG